MKTLLLTLSVALFAGCGWTTTHVVMTGTAGAPYQGEVRIVLESAPVPTGLEEVAIVQAVGRGMEADLEHILAGLKDQARTLGCDTVVRVHIDQGNGTASASGVAARVRPATAPPAPASTPAPPSPVTPAAVPAAAPPA